MLKKKLAEKEKKEKAVQKQVDVQIRRDIVAKTEADKLAAKLAQKAPKNRGKVFQKSLIIMLNCGTIFLQSLDSNKSNLTSTPLVVEELPIWQSKSGRILCTPQHLINK